MNIHFLYNGDVISSQESSYFEIKDTPLTSPTFIINTLIHIYKQSFDIMSEKSKDIILSEESILQNGGSKNIFDHLASQGINPTYIFCSEKSKSIFTQVRSNETRSLPSYFYPIDSMVGLKSTIYFSPYITNLEDDGDTILFVTDGGIQSLVYGIQNMDYSIDSTIDGFTPNIPSKWKHEMSYNLYNCNFNSYKIIIRNIQKTRQEKLNRILDDN